MLERGVEDVLTFGYNKHFSGQSVGILHEEDTVE